MIPPKGIELIEKSILVDIYSIENSTKTICEIFDLINFFIIYTYIKWPFVMALLDTTAEGVIGMRARGKDMQQRASGRTWTLGSRSTNRLTGTFGNISLFWIWCQRHISCPNKTSWGSPVTGYSIMIGCESEVHHFVKHIMFEGYYYMGLDMWYC